MSNSNKPHPLTTGKLELLKTDEGIFAVLFLAMLGLFYLGYHDAAIIVAVYDAVFMYSGMHKYQDKSGDKADEIENELKSVMSDAGEMIEELQEGGKE